MWKMDIKQKSALKAFEALGFETTSYREHIKMRHTTSGAVISLPNHKIIKTSVLVRVCREKGIDKEKFFELV